MPESPLSFAAVQSHAAALQSAICRHAANASRCKVWSGGIVAGMLLLSAGRVQMAALPWAAGVIVLLALADAGQAALARVCTDAYNRFMAKVPLNGGNAMKAECFTLPEPALGWRQAGLVLRALGSFSVWPFHGALLALLAAFFILAPPPQADLRLGGGMPTGPVSSGSVRTFTPGPGSASFPGGTYPAQPMQPGMSSQPGAFTQPGTMSPPASAPPPNGVPRAPTPPLKFPSARVSVPISSSTSPGPNRPTPPSFTPGTTTAPANKPPPPQPGARPPAAQPARPPATTAQPVATRPPATPLPAAPAAPPQPATPNP